MRRRPRCMRRCRPCSGAADKGSVIAKDKAVQILAKLVAAGHADAAPALLERVAAGAPNQFPTYAEQAATVLTGADRGKLAAILTQRIADIETALEAGAGREAAEALVQAASGSPQLIHPRFRD